jgi:putative FmdB family regulatory protein
MPIYEYHCQKCGERFSRLQRVGADSRGVTCPACDSAEVERLLSTFASAPSSGADTPCGAPASSCGSGFT